MAKHRLHPRVASLIAMSLAAFAWIARGDDIDVVEHRAIARVLADPPAQSASIESLLTSLGANGSWADINYANTSNTNWLPQSHLYRLLDMSRAWATPGNTHYGNPSLKAGILNAYDYWIDRDPQSANWWWNQIGGPTTLSQSMLLIQNSLSSSQTNAGLVVLSRSGIQHTGQNLIWTSNVSLHRGIIARDATLMTNAFAAAGTTAVVSTGEGIQRDYSFHQHGHQLYNGGYGMSFSIDVPRIAAYGAGTTFALSGAQQQTIVDFLLDGQQWFSRGDTFDYLTTSRVITRHVNSDLAPVVNSSLALGLRQSVADAMTFGGDRQSELAAMKTRLDAAAASGVADPSLALSGHRHFWRSDITVHHRPQWYASVAMTSSRVLKPEVVNNEGLLSRLQGDGVNLIMRSGNEYDDIFPVWDWRRLPGTTAEQGNYSLRPVGGAGATSFVGGISDGNYGASAMDYKLIVSSQTRVQAKKSWFFFDDEFVALGAGIQAPDPAATAQVITTLNQTLSSGPVTYAIASPQNVLNYGSVTTDALRWVHHDGVGYFFPTAVGSATIKVVSQSGSWNSINATYPPETVTENVFSLQINHGVKPNNATYAYVVAPDIAVDQMNHYSSQLPINILRNDTTVQAVHHTGLNITQAAFHAPATLQITPSLSITPDAASMLMLDASLPGMLTITASNPQATALSLHVRISTLLTGDGAVWNPLDGFTILTFNLPGGSLAGSSVLQSFAVSVPGDFDGDGDVDGADFVAWQTNFPTAMGATLADGDADGDGDVDGADFIVWQTNFPTTPGPGVAPVPEPESLIVMSLGGIIVLAWRQRWR